MTEKEFEVRSLAADYVSDKSTLSDFELWLAPLAWSLEEAADESLRDLVNSIELRIAEFTSGAWDENTLKGLIRDIAVPTSESRVVNFAQRQRRLSIVRSASTRSERLEVCV